MFEFAIVTMSVTLPNRPMLLPNDKPTAHIVCVNTDGKDVTIYAEGGKVLAALHRRGDQAEFEYDKGAETWKLIQVSE